MATPRKYLIDPDVPLFYHLVSRCVRRAWLCGFDPATGRDYSHRKQWLIDRLNFLVQYFAIELHTHSIMSNHFHLGVYHDPCANQRWSDEEVADRWLAVSPPRTWTDEPVSPEMLAEAKRHLLADRKRLAHVRKQLGSVSTFMKFLKQYIALKANAEDGVTGHFFEQRFWSGALISERAIIGAMLYMDLNPVRALIAKSIEEIEHCGITERLKKLEAGILELDAPVAPLVSGLNDDGQQLPISLHGYIELMQIIIDTEAQYADDSPEAQWRKDMATLHRKQRAYGTAEELRAWGEARNWKRRGSPLSA